MPKSPDRFDPTKYKSYEEIPDTEKGNFVKVGNGFVQKEAHEKFTEAEEIASIASHVKGQELTPADVLQVESTAEIRERKDILGKIEYTLEHWYTSNDDAKLDQLFATIPPQLLDDETFVLEAVKLRQFFGNRILRYISSRLRNDRNLFLEVAKYSGGIQYASEELLGDKELVIEAVKVSGYEFEYASAELRSDKDVVLAAVKRNGHNLRFASEALRNDREVVLAAIHEDALNSFQFVSPELRADKEIVIEALRNRGGLGLASDELRDDKEVVMEAVKVRGYQFRNASDRLRMDEEVVLEAMKSRGGVDLEDVPASFYDDKEFLLKVLKVNKGIMRRISPRLLSDKEVVLAALPGSFSRGVGIEFASEELQHDKEFILEALKKGARPPDLRGIPVELKNDFQFILETVKIDPDAIRWMASDEIRKKVGDSLK
ncbi:MAG: DUF4116 domain-containing protein [bacterium]|nr:DUF4116 domain-containing protein [bacterium]